MFSAKQEPARRSLAAARFSIHTGTDWPLAYMCRAGEKARKIADFFFSANFPWGNQLIQCFCPLLRDPRPNFSEFHEPWPLNSRFPVASVDWHFCDFHKFRNIWSGRTSSLSDSGVTFLVCHLFIRSDQKTIARKKIAATLETKEWKNGNYFWLHSRWVFFFLFRKRVPMYRVRSDKRDFVPGKAMKCRSNTALDIVYVSRTCRWM